MEEEEKKKAKEEKLKVQNPALSKYYSRRNRNHKKSVFHESKVKDLQINLVEDYI